jgi:hypothetical protein
MIRPWLATAFAGLVLASAGAGQQVPCRFSWEPGQVLTYRVEQTTTVAEVVEGKKVEITSKLNNVKRWQVLEVDGTGVGTLQLSLVALRMESTTPGGEVLLFDSSDPDKSDAQMREQLAKYVGPPLAVLRVDGRGRVVEVKECKHGPASRYESEPPFVLTLPEKGIQAGQTWERAYAITVAPPQGTGEKYDASQNYVCQTLQRGMATVALTTAVKALPASLLDQVPLLQMQPEGRVFFDTQAGRLQGVVLRVEKELLGHQGEGSSYRLQSNYTEQYAGDK